MFKEYYHIFERAQLCKNIDSERFEQILRQLKPVVRAYKKGETIFSEGEPQRYFGMVLEGELFQSRLSAGGQRALYERFREGQLFGEIMMFLETHSAWRCDTTAKTDCKVMLFATEKFFSDAFLNSGASGQVFFNLTKRVCERYESIQVLLKSLKTRPFGRE